MRIPRFSRAMAFLFACMTPWRWAFRVRSLPSKLSFYVHWKDVNGRHIAKYGTREPLLTAWMCGYLDGCPSTGIFVDVGANVGWHAVHAAQFSAVKTVIAFEPDAFNAWLLDRNLSLNDTEKVVVFNCAVGADNRTAHLHRYKQSNLGRHSLLADYGFGSRVVPLLTLDKVFEAIGLSESRVLILKIDVEGYEPAVIAGAERTLARTDVVVTEWSPGLSRSGDLSTTEMFDRLTAFGFVPHTLTSDGKIDAVASNKLLDVDDQVDVVWLRAKEVMLQATRGREGD
jgi:FkbM family methyltransferase